MMSKKYHGYFLFIISQSVLYKKICAYVFTINPESHVYWGAYFLQYTRRTHHKIKSVFHNTQYLTIRKISIHQTYQLHIFKTGR